MELAIGGHFFQQGCTVYEAVSANGSVSGSHDDKNPFAKNIIFDSYSITPTNQYFAHRFNHVYNLYEKLPNLIVFAY